ncbi:hypothetical protein MBLNU457_2001t1 [Dothideomycetes sp. NU457]
MQTLQAPQVHTQSATFPTFQTVTAPPLPNGEHEDALPATQMLTSSTSPAIHDHRSFSNPVHGSGHLFAGHSPNSSRIPQRSFKDLINQFNQEPAWNRTSLDTSAGADRQKRAREQRPSKLTKPRSPTKSTQARGYGKLQTRREPHLFYKPFTTRIDTSNGNAYTDPADTSPISPTKRSPSKLRKPLFGEALHGESTSPRPGYQIPDPYKARRGSDSSIPQTRRQSNADHSLSASAVAQKENRDIKKHGRSHSDLSAEYYSQKPYQGFYQEFQYPVHSSDTARLRNTPQPDMISYSNEAPPAVQSFPVSPPNTRPRAKNHFPSPRSPKSPNGERTRIPKIQGQMTSEDHTSPLNSHYRRYDPVGKTNTPSGLPLRAYINAPAPQKSPPLRSSRPRQPVSLASTAASRAKVADRMARQESSASEDADMRPRQRKKIPELGRVDFAERRARIERAIGQNIDDRSDVESRTSRSSSRIGGRKTSLASSINDSSAAPVEAQPTSAFSQLRGDQQAQVNPPLHIETERLPAQNPSEPTTAGTEFEEDSLPIQGATHPVPAIVETYHEQERKPTDSAVLENEEFAQLDTPGRMPQRQSLLDSVMKMRESSTSSTERSASVSSQSLFTSAGDSGSIQIMLDGQDLSRNDLSNSQSVPLSQIIIPNLEDGDSSYQRATRPEALTLGSNDGMGSGQEGSDFETPRRALGTEMLISDVDVTPRPHSKLQTTRLSEDVNSDAFEHQSHGVDEAGDKADQQNDATDAESVPLVTKDDPLSSAAETSRTADFDSKSEALSGDGTSDALSGAAVDQEEVEYLSPTTYQAPPLPTTTVSDVENSETHQAVDPVVHTVPISFQVHDEQSDAITGAELQPPPPPPKDAGYSPRSSMSVQRGSTRIDTSPPSPPSARMSKISDFQYLPEIEFDNVLGHGLGLTMSNTPADGNTSRNVPPAPGYAPPAPPPPTVTVDAASSSTPVSASTITENSFASDQGPPSVSRNDTATPKTVAPPSVPRRAGSLAFRPSLDAPRPGIPALPQSQSMSSFSQASTRLPSMDSASPIATEETSADMRRLLKRRNIIKELVDTEYSYHQDMKIIEDIYKATVGDLITTDDKKTLFGNSDHVEAFSLEFYDALRRAVTPFYIPPKSSRWQSKRGSFSTSNSGNADQPAVEWPDDADNKKTVVGQVFLRFLPKMEKVYAAYLKNHDYANQRLSKLQTDPTVKCWLTECHSNASDITSAWDLDSLLVKPVQRILKYPLLLQQLLESTSPDHPDHGSLEAAVKECMNISHRINEAKKRADLVDSIVNRKRKDSDVRTGLAKAFGRRTDKLKERVGIAEAYQDTEFDELAHKFGGHFIRLQVCMRDIQGSLAETDKAVERIIGFANALESYIEVGMNQYPEIESRWRKYIMAIRELTNFALADHKAQIRRRVLDPMVAAIKLHEGPQNAIAKRKKRVVDYAKCKALQVRGEKPDKRTLEASEIYQALNEQLKLDLPRLYSLTADLIQSCLACHVQIQKDWFWTWEMKLRPVLDTLPESISQILPDFNADYEIVQVQVLSLALCNGSMLAETANYLSPQITFGSDDGYKRPGTGTGTGSSRTMSVGSEQTPSFMTSEQSRTFSAGAALPSHNPDAAPYPNGQAGTRMRSSSSISARGRAMPQPLSLPQSRMPSATPKSSFSSSRPPTSSRPTDLAPRPGSSTSYFEGQQQNHQRWSGMFSSALPASDSPSGSSTHLYPLNTSSPHISAAQSPSIPTSPRSVGPDAMPVMFVAASLFEFNIDRSRREAGYPYLTYVQGEVFDVIAQKGELWLAKNQDDATNTLGWIWEQHFVILSQEGDSSQSGHRHLDNRMPDSSLEASNDQRPTSWDNESERTRRREARRHAREERIRIRVAHRREEEAREQLRRQSGRGRLRGRTSEEQMRELQSLWDGGISSVWAAQVSERRNR